MQMGPSKNAMQINANKCKKIQVTKIDFETGYMNYFHHFYAFSLFSRTQGECMCTFESPNLQNEMK